MHDITNYLFVLSILYRSDSGIAIVSAASAREAFTVLKRQGVYNGNPNEYILVQSKNIGMYKQERVTLVYESYTNALVAYDAIVSVMEDLHLESPIEHIKVNGTELEINDKTVNITVPTSLADLASDVSHRTVTDIEKSIWNSKADASAIPDVSGKADRVQSAVAGHIATLDSSGNLVDSGKGISDINPLWGNIQGSIENQTDLMSAFGNKYEKPSTGIPASDIAAGVVPKTLHITSWTPTYASGGNDINLGTRTQAASTLGITVIQLDEMMEREYDSVILSGTEDQVLYASAFSDDAVLYTANAVSSWYGLQFYIDETEYHCIALQEELPTVPTDVVKYSSQSLTDAQKGQARANIGAGTYSKPNGGIPASDMTEEVQQSLALADTAYQKPYNGIPGSDLAAGVIPDVSDVVRYSAQTKTDAQKAQARTNIGASSPELLVAEYNVTPFATVITACLAGKNVIVKKNENYKYVVYSLTMWDGDAQIGGTVKFSRINYSSTTSGTIDTISVDNVDGWKILESIPYQESFFIAQYGVTHWSEVLAAYKDGKVLLCSGITLAQLMVFDPGFEGDDDSEPYEGSAAFIYYDPIEKKLIQLVIDGSTDEWQRNPLRYVSDFDGRYASLSGKPTIPDVTGKADKVSGATNGHLAALDSNGNLTDSGKSASDFATAAQGAKADTALQSFTETDPTVPSWAKQSTKPSYSYSEISGTPTLATVATSGSYNDLSNKPDEVEANPTVPSGTTPGTMETIKIGSQYYELGGGTIDAEDYTGTAPLLVDPSNYYTKSETEALVETPVASTQPSGGFLPNVIYDLGEITGSVTFALATPTDNTIANPYHWTFETGSTAPTVNWPANVTWLEGSAPTIDASCHYEIMIRNGYGTSLKFEIS